MQKALPALALLIVLTLPATVSAQPSDLDPRISALLAEVSERRLADLLKRLQGFETRHTLSTQESPTRGIGAAAQWIHDEMTRSSPRLQVSFDTYDIPAQGDRIVRDVRIRNVVAVLPGRNPRRIYVGAHYDSLARAPRPATTDPPSGASASGTRAEQPAVGGFDWSAADHFQPGANDDGSGTVVVMELARVFAESGVEFDATLVFIAFAGEEQGLVGALLHAQRADAEDWPIEAVFNNDMLGNVVGGDGVADGESVRVFAEGPEDSPSRQLARFIERHATRYQPAHRIRLVARHDRFGRGGDHTAFNQHGFAGVRFCESNEDFSRQHSVDDTWDGVSFEYMARNARANAAPLAVMALAPPAPVVVNDRGRPTLGRQPSGYDANLRWQPSPGAVGYRVFWRDAWTPDWQHEMAVGNVTSVVLPGVSIDDAVFGVAAIGPGGHESVVAAYVNPARAEVQIETQ